MNRQQRLPISSLDPPDAGSNSPIPTFIMLNVYAVVGALVVSRALLKMFEISDRYWVGRQIFRFTDPFARILELLPGANQTIVGGMTMADLTMVIGVILFPLGLLAFGGRRR